MRIVKYKLGVRLDERGCALALGFFDGVHLGHRLLLSHTVNEAKKRSVPSVVFTFSYGSGIKSESAMIYSEKERNILFESLGIDVCFVADFSDIRALSPRDFVSLTVIKDIGASVVSVGYDYRFGYRGAADAEIMRELLRSYGADAEIFDALTLDGAPVSSTRVRACLESGEIDKANQMLGVPYFVLGTVEHGRGDGGGFGYPTINISVDKSRSQLKHGVYLTVVKIGENLYTGLTNVGECPSFGKRDYHTETFILDFSQDVYGAEATVHFLSFIREERVFSSSDELVKQIEKDRECAEKIKEKIKWQEIGLV